MDDRELPVLGRRSFAVLGLSSMLAATGRSRAAKRNPDRFTYDATSTGNATFNGTDGDYTIEAAGHDVWRDADEYGAIYESSVKIDPETTVEVTVDRQDRTHGWAKAGIMLATDITAPGSSPNDLVLAVTPDHGVVFDWDDTGDGYISAHDQDRAVSVPCRLRLNYSRGTAESAPDVWGEYSTDGGDSWTTVGELTYQYPATEAADVGLFVTSHDEQNRSRVSFSGLTVDDGNGENPLESPARPTTDTTIANNAIFSGYQAFYTIEAAGHDVWRDADEYGAIYEPDVSHTGQTVVAETTVRDQQRVTEWSKAGLMVANDITAGGSSPGDLVLAVTPDHGIVFDWDDTGDGDISAHRQAGSTTYPCQLRVTITPNASGTVYRGEYRHENVDSWQTIGETTIDAAAGTQDIGLFSTSHERDTRGATDFSGLTVETAADETPNRPTIDTTTLGNATFTGRDGEYSITAAGHDVWRDADEYGAVYEPEFQPDTSYPNILSEVTVQSQERTHDWAKAGLMLATDITAPGVSRGDCLFAVTPENGLVLDWDDNADGYISEHVGGGEVSYPIRLRFERLRRSLLVGKYRNADDDRWTTLGVVETDADGIGRREKDVGVFTTSHDESTTGTAEFRNFTVATAPTSLPTVDRTPTQDATFSGPQLPSPGAETVVVSAAGHDVWRDADEYAAVYEPRVEGDFDVSVVLQRLDAPHEWTKAGIMVANDITAAGSSPGDLLVAVARDHGLIMDWDDTGDGDISAHQQGCAVSLPCRLELSRTGDEFTGSFATTARGPTVGTIDTVTNARIGTDPDVALFATSHDNTTLCEAEFVDFLVS